MTGLKSRYNMRGGNDVAEGLDQLRSILDTRSIDEVLETGLHEFIDFIQRYLIAITDRLGAAFFGHPPVEKAAWQDAESVATLRCRLANPGASLMIARQ